MDILDEPKSEVDEYGCPILVVRCYHLENFQNLISWIRSKGHHLKGFVKVGEFCDEHIHLLLSVDLLRPKSQNSLTAAP